ncbi:MAG TPA: VWA domain-containing protein [Bryobacteraceae bacterium]|nr:VWA domain-containing protein [Bryobacteraceae bacterium]
MAGNRAGRWTVVLFLAIPCAMLPQGPLTPRAAHPRPSPEAPPGTIRVEASLVLIPVHVVTSGGASVTDLPKESFHLLDEDSEQSISYFAKEDAPVSIGVLLDTSASMQHKMRRSSEAAASVLQSANPADEFFLVEFNERPKLTVPFTTDADQLYRRFLHAGPFGRTSLLDAIHLASVQMKNARNARKALLIVSDGGDNHSRLSRSQVRSEVLESDLQMYAIGIFDGDARKRSPEEANGPGLLEDLAGETGGKHYRVDNLDELASVAHHISIDMRNEYLLGFTPAGAPNDGKYHRVKVTVNPTSGAKLNVFYRRGYYAPAQ